MKVLRNVNQLSVGDGQLDQLANFLGLAGVELVRQFGDGWRLEFGVAVLFNQVVLDCLLRRRKLSAVSGQGKTVF